MIPVTTRTDLGHHFTTRHDTLAETAAYLHRCLFIPHISQVVIVCPSGGTVTWIF